MLPLVSLIIRLVRRQQ